MIDIRKFFVRLLLVGFAASLPAWPFVAQWVACEGPDWVQRGWVLSADETTLVNVPAFVAFAFAGAVSVVGVLWCAFVIDTWEEG